MSTLPSLAPICESNPRRGSIELVLESRTRDLGGFTVRRLLPSDSRRLVGPFIFFDHMGPAEFKPGTGIDVRPHPHINLATVTYLFEGQILHRDSLGSHQAIRPGEINWMTAGRGIVHSERSAPEDRARGSRLHGLQLWVALPKAHEETEPSFHHHPLGDFKEFQINGTRLRVLAGNAYGVESPVHTFSPLCYVDVDLPANAQLQPPPDHAERALYVVNGAITCEGERFEAGRMLVFAPGAQPVLRAESAARAVFVGGAPLDGERLIWWNFVSSSAERMEQAKRDWKEGNFPKVPGDEVEFIPLP